MWYFGTTIEAAQDAAQEALGIKAKGPEIKAARQRVLNSVLSTPDAPPPKGTFREPVVTKKRG